MMQAHNQLPARISGFTLIELLIVLAIVGLLASLVTPAIQTQLDRARAEEEWRGMRRELDRLSWHSFLTASSIEIRVVGNEMSWSSSSGPAESGARKYLFLSFPQEQKIRIDEVGYASPADISVVQGGRERTYPLNKWTLE